MKLRILSDIHLEHDPSFRLSHHGEDAILCAGDLSSWPTRDLAEQFIRSSRVPFFYVLGNHNFYHGEVEAVLDHYRFLAGRLKHFHLLHNQTAQLGSYLVVGTPLWTDFGLYGPPSIAASMALAERSINDFRLTRVQQADLSAQNLVDWKREARAFLKETIGRGKPTIVMTHWCPSAETISPVYAGADANPYFTTECRALMGDNVLLWVHGHSHIADDRVINRTRVLRNPKGYPGEHSQWNEQLILSLATH